MSNANVWAELAAPLDPENIRERNDKDVKIYYIDARTVIERLNSVCPGEWTFETELLHAPMPGVQGDKWVFKGRLTVCGVWHEDVGMNDNEKYFDPPKSAVSDALKRCAVHFGIGIELYPGGGRAKPGKSTNVKPTQTPARQPVGPQDASQALPRTDANPQRPYAPKSLLKWFDLQIKAATPEQRDSGITVETAKALAMAFKNTGLSDHERSDFGKALLGVDSFKDLSLAAANAMASWLKDVKSARAEVQDYLASLGTTEG